VLQYGTARLRLSLQGAHITEYAPLGDDNLLWISQSARFQQGTAIRGGIPLCWPWFGNHPDRPDRPQHGFARNSRFRIISERDDAQMSAVLLALDTTPEFSEWRSAASLEVEIRLSDTLWMEVRTTNTSDGSLWVGAGLHSYFKVSDCHEITIPALTGLDYLDKTQGFARSRQLEPMRISGEVDRVYLAALPRLELMDPHRPSHVAIDAWGHTDLVIWNPGPVTAAGMSDFDDLGFRNMVCIEPALALNNRKRLAAGDNLVIGQTLHWVRPTAFG